MKEIGCDVETTGLDPEINEITELALVYHTGKGVKEFHRLICPGSFPLNYNETVGKITGLTAEKLIAEGIPSPQAHRELLEWLDSIIDRYNKQDKAFMYGYNVGFDNRFMRSFFKKNNDKYFGSYFFNCKIDVMTVVGMAEALNVIEPLENHRLETVANRLDVKIEAHQAISDIKATRQIYEKLLLMISQKVTENKLEGNNE